MAPDEPAERFSLVAGGPFHTTLRGLRLIGPDELPTPRAAVVLASLAWLLPASLTIAQSVAVGRQVGWEFFTDLTAYTRYLVAIWMMIATERYADGRIVLMTRQFRNAGLLSPGTVPAFRGALDTANRRSSSGLAELVIIVAAIAWSGLTADHAVAIAGSSWEGTVVAGWVELSWAGAAARFLSTPLFLFLVFRWIWRFFVWAVLLYRISRLPLLLTPMHPDRSAGLGFLAIYPSVFTGFVFALACVTSSSMLKELSLARHSPETIWFVMAGWLALILAVFLGPLLVFAGPLYRTRERALLDYGRLASQHHLAFDRTWIAEARNGADLMGSADPSSTSDLNASVEVVRELRIVPIDLHAVVQLVLAAAAPLLAVVATQIPLSEVASWIAGAIL